MNIELTKAVGEVASENPAFIQLFEEMKIDYCCGGNRSFKDACQLAGIPVEKMVSMMEKVQVGGPVTPGDIDWRGKSIEEVADYILEKHHSFTHFQLTRLRELALQTARVHGEKHPELKGVRSIVNDMAEEMEGHMAKEEEQVFPYLKALEKAGWNKEVVPNPFQGGSFTNHPLKVLMWEHGMTGEEFAELHRLTEDFSIPDDACPSYRALYTALGDLERDLHRHVHLENNVLFQMAMGKGLLD